MKVYKVYCHSEFHVLNEHLMRETPSNSKLYILCLVFDLYNYIHISCQYTNACCSKKVKNVMDALTILSNNACKFLFSCTIR